MRRANRLVVSVPTHDVHHCEATKKLTHLIAGFGPHHKLPVIGHSHHRINWYRDDFPRFSHNTDERGKVFRLFKNREPSHCSIQNAEDFTCRTNADPFSDLTGGDSSSVFFALTMLALVASKMTAMIRDFEMAAIPS